MEAMEEIEKRTEERQKAASEAPKDEEPAPAPKTETKPEAAEPAAPAATEPPATPEAPKTSKQKVDGEEYDVPLEEIEAAGGEKPWRIQKASENRLAKANEALAQVQRLKAELAQQAQPPKPPEPTDDEFIKSKVDIIRFGTSEESAAALREVMSRGRLDPNQLTAHITQRISHDAAEREFDTRCADLVTNPVILHAIHSLRMQKAAAAKKAGTPINNWGNFYSTIEHEVRSAFGRPSQSATPSQAVPATNGTPSQVPSEKEARKSSIVNLPKAAARAEIPSGDSKPETREDMLNEVRRKRGLPIG